MVQHHLHRTLSLLLSFIESYSHLYNSFRHNVQFLKLTKLIINDMCVKLRNKYLRNGVINIVALNSTTLEPYIFWWTYLVFIIKKNDSCALCQVFVVRWIVEFPKSCSWIICVKVSWFNIEVALISKICCKSFVTAKVFCESTRIYCCLISIDVITDCRVQRIYLLINQICISLCKYKNCGIFWWWNIIYICTVRNDITINSHSTSIMFDKSKILRESWAFHVDSCTL